MENITLGNIATILGLIVSIITGIEFLAMRMRRWLQKEMYPIKQELKETSLNTMKNSICNDNIPISERISIGQKYIEKGGNGAVKIRVHQLEEQYEKELKKGGKHNETTR